MYYKIQRDQPSDQQEMLQKLIFSMHLLNHRQDINKISV